MRNLLILLTFLISVSISGQDTLTFNTIESTTTCKCETKIIIEQVDSETLFTIIMNGKTYYEVGTTKDGKTFEIDNSDSNVAYIDLIDSITGTMVYIYYSGDKPMLSFYNDINWHIIEKD